MTLSTHKIRRPHIERERELPPGVKRPPLGHWFTTDETFDFYYHWHCTECGLPEADHYRKTMLDDIYQLGFRQARLSPFEVSPSLPPFLARSVRCV